VLELAVQKRVTTTKRVFKLADDTYLVTSAVNSRSYVDEISHIETCASNNNLKLNQSSFSLFSTRAKKGNHPSQSHAPCYNIARVNSLRVLGVIVNDRRTASDHVTNLMTSCSSLLMYALRVLRSQGILTTSPPDVLRATVLAKIAYCSPAWWPGLCSASDRARVGAFLGRCKRLGFCDTKTAKILNIFTNADDILFDAVMKNS